MEREREHDPVPTSMLPLAMDGWKTSATARTLLPLVLVSHYPHQHILTKYASNNIERTNSLFHFQKSKKSGGKTGQKSDVACFLANELSNSFHTILSLSLSLHVLLSLHRHAIILKATAYIRCPSNPPKKKIHPTKAGSTSVLTCVLYILHAHHDHQPLEVRGLGTQWQGW